MKRQWQEVQPRTAGVRGWAKAMGPSLSAGARDCSVDRRAPGETHCGGEKLPQNAANPSRPCSRVLPPEN